MKVQGNPHLTSSEIAHVYDELFKEESRLRDSDAFYKWVFGRLQPQPGGRLLDVACGEGLFIQVARQHGVKGLGVDLSSQAAGLARRRLGAPVDAATAVVSVANGEHLPFADQSFDYVTNIGSLEHFLDPLLGVQEMRRVLRPGGVAAVILPNSYYLVDIIWEVWRTGYSVSHHQPLERFATFREWWDFLESGGLRVVKGYKYNFCFPRSKADWQWYRQHPRKVLNLLVSPFIPFNLSNHFLYVCERKA
jgi:ubiquinone/menaquinone biosynthesis C-methylase UbiE